MDLRIYTFSMEWSLRGGLKSLDVVFDARGGPSLSLFWDSAQVRQLLEDLFSDEGSLARLREFLAGEYEWSNLRGCPDWIFLDRVATAVCSGRIQLQEWPMVRKAAPARRVVQPIAEPSIEEWVEAEPLATESEPAAERETFVVSDENAAALAEENRNLHASGVPFKQLCLNQKDCPVCAAAGKVMAA